MPLEEETPHDDGGASARGGHGGGSGAGGDAGHAPAAHAPAGPGAPAAAGFGTPASGVVGAGAGAGADLTLARGTWGEFCGNSAQTVRTVCAACVVMCRTLSSVAGAVL